MASRRPIGLCATLAAICAAGPLAAQQADPPPAVVATPLDAVTATGTRMPTVSGDSVAPVSVLSREEILERDARSVTETIRDVPGVELSGVGRTTALQPLIRGLGDDRIVFRIDGARNNFNAGHRGRIFIDPELLRQIDVMRGPGSALYGSGAIGGVINMRTIEPDDIIQPDSSCRWGLLPWWLPVAGRHVARPCRRRCAGRGLRRAGRDFRIQQLELHRRRRQHHPLYRRLRGERAGAAAMAAGQPSVRPLRHVAAVSSESVSPTGEFDFPVPQGKSREGGTILALLARHFRAGTRRTPRVAGTVPDRSEQGISTRLAGKARRVQGFRRTKCDRQDRSEDPASAAAWRTLLQVRRH